jgi:MFS family permease
MMILIILVTPVARRWSDKLGSRWLMTAGLTLLSGSLLVFAQLQTDSSYLSLLPGMLLGGVGMAIVMTPMTAAALSSVPVDKAGVGSGMLNTFRPGRRLARDRRHGRDPRGRHQLGSRLRAHRRSTRS